jgi:hypothetical protein
MKSLVAAAGHAKHTAEIASALACASETRHAALGCKNATPTFEVRWAQRDMRTAMCACARFGCTSVHRVLTPPTPHPCTM